MLIDKSFTSKHSSTTADVSVVEVKQKRSKIWHWNEFEIGMKDDICNSNFSNCRQSQSMRPQFQQPLSAEILSQQQQLMVKQLQQQQLQHPAAVGGVGALSSGIGLSVNSPKRVELNPSNRQQLLSQTIIHQTYGVQPQQPLAQSHILAQYQSQQSTNVAANLQLRQISASTVIPSTYSTSSPSPQQQQQQTAGISPVQPDAANSFNRNLACLPISYYPPQQHFVAGEATGAALHSAQVGISSEMFWKIDFNRFSYF